MIGSKRKGHCARWRSGRIARHQRALAERTAAVAGAGDPESTVVLSPGSENPATRCGCDVEAALVPCVAVEATLAVTCPRPRRVHRRTEGAAAVTGDGKHDLAAVRPPGEDDLVPKHMKTAGIIRCPRKPLQQHGLAPLVDRSCRELASRALRDGGVVDEVVARLVLLPHAALVDAAHDLPRGLPTDLRSPAGARAEQQRRHPWRPLKSGSIVQASTRMWRRRSPTDSACGLDDALKHAATMQIVTTSPSRI